MTDSPNLIISEPQAGTTQAVTRAIDKALAAGQVVALEYVAPDTGRRVTTDLLVPRKLPASEQL